MATIVKRKKGEKTSKTTEDLFQRYLALRGKRDVSSSMERCSHLQALLRGVLFKGGLREDIFKSIIGDKDCAMMGWYTWYQDLSNVIAEGGDYEISEQARKAVEVMVGGVAAVEADKTYIVADKSVIFLQTFRFAEPLIRAKIVSGEFPTGGRLLKAIGGVPDLMSSGQVLIKPYDLHAVVEVINAAGKQAVDRVYDMLDVISGYRREPLLNDYEGLTCLMDVLPVKVIKGMKSAVVGDGRPLSEYIYNRSILSSQHGEEKLRQGALKFFKDTSAIASTIKLGAVTSLPEGLIGKGLAELMVFLAGNIENPKLLRGIPEEAVYKTLTADLLLSGKDDEKALFTEGSKAMTKVLKATGAFKKEAA